MGVYHDKRTGRWVARSKSANGKREYLGAFKTKQAAVDTVKAMEMWDAAQLIPITLPDFDMPLSFWQKLKARLRF